MDVRKLSSQYTVRPLIPADAETVYEVLKGNTIFYQYHPPTVTVESILEDMAALPPGKGYDEKHYIGFFSGEELVAVMDLIENYPRSKTALIGFFAVNSGLHGNGIGSAIISDCINCLSEQGFTTIRLGIDKGNPQSRAFWCKNGFLPTGEEYAGDSSAILVLERPL